MDIHLNELEQKRMGKITGYLEKDYIKFQKEVDWLKDCLEVLLYDHDIRKEAILVALVEYCYELYDLHLEDQSVDLIELAELLKDVEWKKSINQGLKTLKP